MKRILPLSEPTPGLKQYLNDTDGETRDWEQFRNYVDYIDSSGNSAYKELMLNLQKRQHGLCAYCEIDLKENDRQIEHFHPKSDKEGGVEWAFLPSNFLAACKGGDYRHAQDPSRYLAPDPKKRPKEDNRSCGAFHGNDELQDGQHPAQLPAMPSIFVVVFTVALGEVDAQAIIKVDADACDGAAISHDQAEATLRTLNLNCTRLKNARSEVWKKLEEDRLRLWEEGKNDDEALSELASLYLRPDDSGKLLPFFTTRRSFFGEYAEELLLHHPEEWI